MTIAEMIYDRTKLLPESLQKAVLRYVDRISGRESPPPLDDDWVRFSESQLSKAYCDADSIYDEDDL